MKKCLLALIPVLMFAVIAHAQLTGTKTIPGDYATIELAIADLNLQGVGTGGVTFNVAAGHTETFTTATAGVITATGTDGNKIAFLKSGAGNNPLITASNLGTVASSTTLGAHGDGIIIIEGGDFITFDGIDLQEFPGATGNAKMEYGYYLKKASGTDAPKDITIKNCNISLDKTTIYSFGIFVSNISGTTTATVTSTGGRSENIKIFGNNISNVYGGIQLRGFLASTPFDFYDQNIEIGVDAPNLITNYGGGSTATYGIYAIYANNVKIANNTIISGTGSTSTLYGIFTSTGTSSNIDIYLNVITVEGAGTTSLLAGISNAMGSTAAGNTVNIYGNIVTNCTYPTATSGAFAALINSASAATVNVYDNIVVGNSLPGTGTFTGIDGGAPTILNMYQNQVYNNTKTGASGSMFLTRGGTAIVTYHSNDVYNNGFTASSGTSSCIIYGYYNFGSPTVENIYDNNIYDLSVAGTNTGTSSLLNGMHTNTTSSAVKNIYNNSIRNLSALSGNVNGIAQFLGTNVQIYQNEIYNLSNQTTVATAATMCGITVSSGTVYAYNNFISDLRTPASASVDAIRGINITSSTANSTVGLYYNTIYLDASSTGATFGSSGVFHTYNLTGTTATLDMRNNIIVNKSTPAGTGGNTVAFRRSAATNLNNYGASSNNNAFYAGEAGANNLIYFDGTNSYQTMAAFQSAVAPRESVSFSENPPFVDVSTTPYDLQLEVGPPTQCESGGQPISTPIMVTTDYFGTTRNATTPDVGAHEGDFEGLDLTAPFISYTTIGNSPTGASLAFDGVIITDATGVNVTSGTKPRVYYKKSTDANDISGWKYVESTSSSSPFDFVINYVLLTDGSVTAGDIIQYFVVAQDLAPTPNVGINSGDFAAAPSSVNLTSAAFPITGTINEYLITASLCGAYTVGTGGDYETFTGVGGFFEAVNGSVITCNLVANVITDITEDGTNALNQWSESGAGNYTLTIQPGTPAMKTISGTFTGGLIRLNGADRVIFDGGAGKNLTIQNNATVANTAAIQVISLGNGAGAENVTIKNCVIMAGEVGSTTTLHTFGIYAGSATISNTGTGADNENLVIENNLIKKARYAIYARATSTNANDGLIITGNEIGSSDPAEYVTFRGIDLTYAQGPVVTQNYIHDMKIALSASNAAMDFGAGVNDAVVTRNIITGIYGESTGGYGAYGINFSSSTSVANNLVANNFISDIRTVNYSSSSTTFNAFGIRLVGGTGTRVYFNSVNLFGDITLVSGSPTVPASAALLVTSTSVSGLELINNIFVNTQTFVSGSPKIYSVWFPASYAGLAVSNHNAYYGTNGVSPNPTIYHVGRVGTTDYTTLLDWQGFTTQDANSVFGEPGFISSTDLHINTAFPSVVNNAGLTLAAVTDDIDGDLRQNPPDIGADEYVYDPPACLPPTAQNASGMTDVSAILDWTENGTAGNWHIELGPQGFTPTGLPANYISTTLKPYTYTGLSELTSYDWYIRAACNPFGGIFSTWTGPHTFSTTATPMSGTYTINSAVPTGGTNFQSFTDFATKANLGGLAGPVIVNVVAASGPYNEQVILGELNGSSVVNTLTINGNGETLEFLSTTSAERATLKFNGTDYVTVNNLVVKALGESSSSPTEYGWVVWLANGADFNTFSECHFIATTTSTSLNFNGFVTSNSATSVTTAGLAASNLKVLDCVVTGGYYGMVINGPTSAPYAENAVITGNVIKDFYLYGLYLRSQNNGSISGNQVVRPARVSNSTYYGIYLTGDFTGTSVTKNLMYDMAVVGATTSALYGFYGTGVTATLGQELLIANNLVYGTSGMNGTQYGMYLLTTDNVKIYHNTISLDNLAHPGSSLIRGIHHSGNLATIDIRNNIVSVTSNSTGTKYCLYFVQTAANVPNLTSDHNVLHMGATAGTNHIGYWDAVSYTTLEDWQGVNGGIYDQSSVDANPLFTTPLLTPQNGLVNNMGTNLLSVVPDDYFGVTRTATPDPGAIEFAPATCLAPYDLMASNITAYTADLSWTGPGNAVSWDIELGIAGFTPTGVPTQSAVTNPYTYTGLTPDTPYEYYVRGFCGGSDYSNWAGPYGFTTDVTCPHPTDLTTIALDKNQATLGWTSGATLFDIEYGAAPYTFTGTPTLTDIANPVTLLSLLPFTNYEYKVRANCGVEGYSIWSDMGTFKTLCDYATITSTTPGTRCGTGTVELAATASDPLAGLNWFDAQTGGNLLGTGSPFTTPVITETTNFYVSASLDGGSESAGKPTYIGTDNTSGSQWGLVFDVVNSNITINSVDVYSVGTGGQMEVQLRDNTGLLLQTVGPFTYPSGSVSSPVTVTFNLNLDVPVGNGYRLVSNNMSGNLIREFSANNNYPYTSASGNVVVTSGFITNPGSTTYYWFYNWDVTAGCQGPRVPVEATVTTPPALTITGDQTICSNTITSLTVTSPLVDYDVYTWSPIAGLFTDSDCTVPYVEDQNAITVYVKSPTVGVLTYNCFAENTVSGCATSASTNVTLLVNPPDVFVTPDMAFADGSIQQLVASGGTAPVDVPVLVQDFNSGLGTWTVTAGSSNPICDFASIASPFTGSPSFTNFSTLDGGNFMMANSDAGGSGSTTNTSLVSPVFSLAGSYLSAKVTFEHIYFKWTSGDVFTNVEISTDGGTNWALLINYVPLGSQGVTTTNAQQTTTATLDLTPYLNETNLRLRFRYETAWGYYWLLDDIVVAGTIPGSSDYTWSPFTNLWLDAAATVPYAGEITGTVYANPTSPITYFATVTAGNGCTSSGSCEFISAGYEVSGVLTYAILLNHLTMWRSGDTDTFWIPNNWFWRCFPVYRSF
jgi:hypothetical protein